MVRRIQSKNTTIKQTRQAYAHAHIAKPWRQTTKPPPPPTPQKNPQKKGKTGNGKRKK